MLPNISFSTLRMFEAAARLGSFKLAAEEMNISPSAVSQQIKLLEGQLGFQLFTRYYRRLELTAIGVTLSEGLTPAFSDIKRVLRQITENQPSDLLRIAIYQTTASRWLVPMLPDLQTKHPNLSVEFETGVEKVDLHGSSIDLAIRLGDGYWPDCEAIMLFEEALVPVCSPALVRQVREPWDLQHTTLVYSSNRPDDWSRWMAASTTLTTHGIPLLQVSNSSLAIDAARHGAGVALAQINLIQTELENGSLIPLFKNVWKTGRSFYLLSSKLKQPSLNATVFKAWIEQHVLGEQSNTLALEQSLQTGFDNPNVLNRLNEGDAKRLQA